MSACIGRIALRAGVPIPEHNQLLVTVRLLSASTGANCVELDNLHAAHQQSRLDLGRKRCTCAIQ